MSPFRTVLFFVLLSLLGLASMPFLPIDYIPTPASRSFMVSFSYPGRAPRIVEQEVTALLENHLSQLHGLESVTSVSHYGHGQVTLVFAAGSDMAYREMEVRSVLRRVKPLLPEEVPYPTVNRNEVSDGEKQPLMVYELRYAVHDQSATAWLTDHLLPRLGSMPGVDVVQPTGHRQFAWKVAFDEARLLRLGISARQVLEAIRAYTGRNELGLATVGSLIVPLHQEWRFTEASDLKEIPLGRGMHLADVADVSLEAEQVQSYRRINGKSAILVSVFPHKGQQRIRLASEVAAVVASLQLELPPGIELHLNYDDTVFLKGELDKTWWRAGLSMLIISAFIFLSSLNLRVLLVLLTTVLVSLAITAGLAFLIGLEVNLYSLAGITISVGLVVDNAIMIVYQLRKYHNIHILTAQLASGLTTVASLSVILALPERVRLDLAPFASVICLALTVSFVVAWWFTPALATLAGMDAKMNKGRGKGSRISALLWRWYTAIISLSARYRKLSIAVMILAFGLPVFLIPAKWQGKEWYNSTVGSDAYQMEVRPWVNKLLGGALRLFYQDVYENSFYRTPERTRLYVTARLPYGHTLEQMDQMVRYAEEYLADQPNVEKFVCNVSSARYAHITIDFTRESENGDFPYLLKSRLIQRSIDWGGVKWGVYGVGQGFSNASNDPAPSFRVAMKGYHYEQLEQWAEVLAERLLEHRRITSVNTDAGMGWWSSQSMPEYHFEPNGALGGQQLLLPSLTTIYDKAPALAPSIRLTYNHRQMPLYMEAKSAKALSLYDVSHFGIASAPLATLGSLVLQKTNTSIHKEERQYLRNIAFEYNGSYNFGEKYLNQVLERFTAELPPGFTAEAKRWSWGSQEEKRKYSLILVLMVAIFFIATIFTESFRQGMLVVLVVPLSFIGLFLIFGWGGFAFDQGGYAAFLLIGGLSVNAVLYLLHDYNMLKKTSAPNRALIRTIQAKWWPVTLTVISTCLGLVPFLMHGDKEVFWFSFAIGTIGGLIFSLVVVFWFLPVLMWRGEKVNEH